VSDEVTADIHTKSSDDILSKVYSYSHDKAQELWRAILAERGQQRVERYQEYHKKGYFETPELPENQPPMTLRKAINYSLFDIFMLSDDAVLFGEDVAILPERFF